MSRTAACMMKKGPRRLVAMCASNISGVVSRSVPRSVRAAALTTQSTRPNALIVSATEATAWSTTATSARMNSGSVPRASSSSTRPSAISGRRPVTTTASAPQRAAVRATAAPTPCVPPLTRTTLPVTASLLRTVMAAVNQPQPWTISHTAARALSESAIVVNTCSFIRRNTATPTRAPDDDQR